MDVTIRSIRLEAEDVRSFELVPVGEEALPPWTPGAHIQVVLPGGLRRAYSLCNHPGERAAYRIAVKLDPASRGGSHAMHRLQVGERLSIGAPSNLFALDAGAPRHVLLAGGIGVTPLYAMFNAVRGSVPCELHYFVRSRRHAAFAERLGEHATLHLGLDAEETRIMLDAIVSAQADAPRTCFYSCGPVPFMAAVEAALARAGVDPARLRSERFGAGDAAVPAAAKALEAGAFQLRFARSGIEVEVPPGVPIIEVARACGVDIPTSCEQGVCGACQSEVLDGSPLHQDAYLSEAERAAGRIMLPCVSRCAGTRLVLDR